MAPCRGAITKARRRGGVGTDRVEGPSSRSTRATAIMTAKSVWVAAVVQAAPLRFSAVGKPSQHSKRGHIGRPPAAAMGDRPRPRASPICPLCCFPGASQMTLVGSSADTHREILGTIWEFGEPGGIRTHGPKIKSHVISGCQTDPRPSQVILRHLCITQK
jgi:hypothetical protein